MAAEQLASEEPGVYYDREDYAGLFSRILIILVDLVALAAIGYALHFACLIMSEGEREAARRFVVIMLFVVPWYLAILKRSPGTVGFLLLGVRVVDLRGRTPGVFRMLFRLLIWFAGPFNFIFDLFWLTGDENRQTLRDKWAGTYVIRKGAKIRGEGVISRVNYCLFGFNMIFSEVRAEHTD